MAKAKNSRLLAAAALLGGLCLGAAGMSTAIGNDYLSSSRQADPGYTLRPDLDLLEGSPRVEAALPIGIETRTPNAVRVRDSDPLNPEVVQSPVRLVISSIGIDANISAVGIEPTNAGRTTSSPGQTTVAVPGVDEAGWYKFGSAPGQPGATVLAGHVDLSGRQGVFWSLDELAPGALVQVHMSDGSVVKYRIMRGTDFSRAALPSEELFRQTGAPALHLITCGGAFNENLGRYESNYVVTAAPIYDNA